MGTRLLGEVGIKGVRSYLEGPAVAPEKEECVCIFEGVRHLFVEYDQLRVRKGLLMLGTIS